ncbi:hypothetical protein [Sagittula salina]|uniref:Uncharacterized protein n=1 Tax=Sagittula salina TaxID=2820268 RepID=A0A940S138_9RHOB|nr:hypothetical protein [Sagittula salina]MBP0482721.1 hypothetical protein [Sagittula salina]
MRRLWREAPYLTGGLALALLVATVFAVRLALGALFWADPEHRDMPIAPWMTPRFVAMSWHLPKDVVTDALGLNPGAKRDGHGPEPLSRLAEERGVPVADLITDLEAAIVAYRASLPPDGAPAHE